MGMHNQDEGSFRRSLMLNCFIKKFQVLCDNIVRFVVHGMQVTFDVLQGKTRESGRVAPFSIAGV